MNLKYNFGGNDYEDGDDFEYEVDWADVKSALTSIILKDKSREELIDVILDMENGCCEYYEEELTEYFEDEAYEAYKDAEEYRKDPLGYYGMSQSDFI